MNDHLFIAVGIIILVAHNGALTVLLLYYIHKCTALILEQRETARK